MFLWSCQLIEVLTEVILYSMMVFSPWAFGTTEEWAISIMNIAGYSLGILLLAKWIIRWRLGRWSVAPAPTTQPRHAEAKANRNIPRLLTRFLVWLTFALLLYCAIGALNARAVYHGTEQRFEFRDHLQWLPHSYDRLRTWKAFENYLALALVFWATRDWLLGQTTPGDSRGNIAERNPLILPARLRRLLWVLALNGALLGMEGILQRLEGSSRLLWLVKPTINYEAASQFGPYAYRSNAAQYFNLVWPICLGFWWVLQRGSNMNDARRSRFRRGAQILLLPSAMIMAACPVISASRGGALIAALQMIMVMIIFFVTYRRSRWRTKLVILLIAACTAAIAGFWGWEELAPRLKKASAFDLGGREIIYQNASRMAQDYPVFGTGPGTFGPLYQFYLTSPDQDWIAQAHNDWLETRITFGLVGLALILLALATVLVRWFWPDGIAVSARLVIFFWLSLAGCLLHARFDFPFQVYSILFLFVLLSSILFCLSRRQAAARLH